MTSNKTSTNFTSSAILCYPNRDKIKGKPRIVYSIENQKPSFDVTRETIASMVSTSIVFRTSNLPYSQRMFDTATQVTQNMRPIYRNSSPLQT
jgi:hypothetical protein